MKNALAKQSKYLAEISPFANSDRLNSLSATIQESRRDNSAATDVNYRDVDAERYFKTMNETLKKGLISETSPLNSNMAKLFKEVKKQTKAIEKMSSDRSKEITEKSMKTDQFRTIRERIQDFGKGVKDFFTLKGFVNKTGLVKEDSGGIISTAINRRARRMEYIDERRKVDPNNIALQGLTGLQRSLAEERLYGGQFDQQQTIKRQQRGNEAEIAKLEKAGFNESQIKRSGLFKTRENLAGQLEKVDSRVRVSKENEKATAKKSTSGQSISAESFSDEAAIENQRAQDKMVDLLAQIEENTRPIGKDVESKKKPEAGKGGLLGMLGGILESALGFLKKGLIIALKFIFNPRNILKFVTKIFLPAMIIGSIVNGIIDAFKAFFNGGDFIDVLVAGLGGVLEFLTFGLLDAKSLKAGIEWMGNAVDEYIVEPVKKFFSWMGNIFDEYIMQPILNIGTKLYGLLDEYVLTPLANLFEPVASFFNKIKDQLFGFFENFSIPEIGFTIPVVNEKVSIGPFYPFKKEASTTKSTSAPTAPTTSTAPTAPTAPTGAPATGSKVEELQAARDAYAKKGPISNSPRARQTYESVLALKDKAIAAEKQKLEMPTDKGDPAKRVPLALEMPTDKGDPAKRVPLALEMPTDKGDPRKRVPLALEMPTDKGDPRKRVPLEMPTDKGDPRKRIPFIETPTPSTGNAIYNKSANNAAAAQAPQSAAPVIVNAPTSVNNTNKQNIAMPTPIRNEDSGFNRYMNRSAFAN